jgi:asparagine synthetase B (glutamine-hydrolysing)
VVADAAAEHADERPRLALVVELVELVLEGGAHAEEQVATLLDDTARQTDVVARYGGEEFVVVMPETDLAQASVFAERFRARVDKERAVAMSGGLDSSVAAALLVESGAEVIGITARMWKEGSRCCSLQDIEQARRVCGYLGIYSQTIKCIFNRFDISGVVFYYDNGFHAYLTAIVIS